MYEFLQKLKCTVTRVEIHKASYEVLIHGDNIKASLVCIEPLMPGDEVLGLFGDCMDGKYLLTIDGADLLRMREVNKNR